MRDANNQVLAFLPADEIPVIVLNRNDIDEDDESAKDSATGIIQRNGKWSFLSKKESLNESIDYLYQL